MSEPKKVFSLTAEVTRVVDGDTFDATVDHGYHVFTRQRYRLAGLNAPEVHGEQRSAGLAAADELRKMIEGKTVTVDTTGTDKYGRWIATVYSDGLNVNEYLIASGFAEPHSYE